ncbi:unnamed protein product [Dracunculus medinensis]|uniref:Uncharacterized protein n=1 Tax=Dracunculus medinensis TaxID=318479 RepID=A0A0N4UA65_DRAME|nr:unnamed protein product [Dracunculus medinensis]
MASTIGKYGIGDRCAIEERLLHYADEHELSVTNTCFRHHRKHLCYDSSQDPHKIDNSQKTASKILQLSQAKKFRNSERISNRIIEASQ